MSPEQQRIKIAEACGWTKRDVDYGPRVGNLWISPDGLTNGDSNTAFWIPDYLNDLNAMHEAEKVLTPEQRVIYWDRLQDVSEYSWHTTAAQRAEEFLRTLNLWKE